MDPAAAPSGLLWKAFWVRIRRRRGGGKEDRVEGKRTEDLQNFFENLDPTWMTFRLFDFSLLV